MRIIMSLLVIIVVFSCSKDDNKTNQQTSNCLHVAFLESIIIEPNDCFSFTDRAGLEFTFLEFENYTKTHPNNSPFAGISARLTEANTEFTFYNGQVHEDHITEGIQFNGRVHTAVNNVEYTLFFDNIEFTETETQFIFHKATIRFGYYDSESD